MPIAPWWFGKIPSIREMLCNIKYRMKGEEEVGEGEGWVESGESRLHTLFCRATDPAVGGGRAREAATLCNDAVLHSGKQQADAGVRSIPYQWYRSHVFHSGDSEEKQEERKGME